MAMPATIHVCPMTRVEGTVTSSGARHLVSLLTAGTDFGRPALIAAENHLWLTMNDIVAAQDGLTPPGRAHVEALLDFARRWDRDAPLVINCFAGISRSTAAAYIVAAALAPGRDEHELARTLRALSPSATPNLLLVGLADDLLRRDGRMVAAIAAIGRGAEAFEGTPFALPIS
ncbi:tyrosine phosphatase family protein [Mesorhizobium sp. L-8-10]|uniref:tyrosine phosphatase family protein n=1 Tax=Mesorhizobium sp. L-8-10 TaxID=2744523 RepID=UPI001FD00EED|nr:protein tyrosine phosphatase [Mesorhizobium sp. L-8-10]